MNQRVDQTPQRIAFVQACWHKEIVDRCRTAFAAEIAKHGYGEGDVDYFEVPGSFEIPLHAQILADAVSQRKTGVTSRAAGYAPPRAEGRRGCDSYL